MDGLKAGCVLFMVTRRDHSVAPFLSRFLRPPGLESEHKSGRGLNHFNGTFQKK